MIKLFKLIYNLIFCMDSFMKMVFKILKRTNEFFFLFKQGFVEKSEVPLFKRFIFYLVHRTSIDEMRADVMYHLYNNNLRKALTAIRKLRYFSSGLTFYDKQFALDVAIFKNDLDVVKLLLELNVDVNYPSLRNRMHELPISFAMRMQHYQIVDALIDAGSFPELPPTQKEKFTALHYACMDGNIAYMEKLLRLGADPNRQTDLGHTALLYAVTNNHKHLTFRLVEEGAQIFPLKPKQKSLRDKNGAYFSLIVNCLNLYYSIIKEDELCADCLQSLSQTSRQVPLKFAVSKKDSGRHKSNSGCSISCCRLKLQLERLSSQSSASTKAELMVEMHLVDEGMAQDFREAFQVDIDVPDEAGVPVVVRLVRSNNALKLLAALQFMPRLNNFSDCNNSPLLCALLNRNGRRVSFIIAAAAGNHLSSHSKYPPSISSNHKKSNTANNSNNNTRFNIKSFTKHNLKTRNNNRHSVEASTSKQSDVNEELVRQVLARLSSLQDQMLSLLLFLSGFPCLQVPIPIHSCLHEPSNSRHNLLHYRELRALQYLTVDGCTIDLKEHEKVDRMMNLSCACRVVVRRAVSDHLKGAVLAPEVVSQLPLPSPLIDFILFQDLSPELLALIKGTTLRTLDSE